MVDVKGPRCCIIPELRSSAAVPNQRPPETPSSIDQSSNILHCSRLHWALYGVCISEALPDVAHLHSVAFTPVPGTQRRTRYPRVIKHMPNPSTPGSTAYSGGCVLTDVRMNGSLIGRQGDRTDGWNDSSANPRPPPIPHTPAFSAPPYLPATAVTHSKVLAAPSSLHPKGGLRRGKVAPCRALLKSSSA